MLSKVLPYIKKAELADAMMALGAAHFENGDKKEAKRTFVRLLMWRSDYKVDIDQVSAGASSRSSRTCAKRSRGRSAGRSRFAREPAAAQAYVDGKYIGVTPTFADGLHHRRALGDAEEGRLSRRRSWPAQVSSKVQQLVSLPIERSTKYLLVEQALAGVEKSLGARRSTRAPTT